jgi:hypothetical protein
MITSLTTSPWTRTRSTGAERFAPGDGSDLVVCQAPPSVRPGNRAAAGRGRVLRVKGDYCACAVL